MELIVNNNIEQFAAEQMTINELLQAKKYSFKMLVIRVNQELIPKEAYDSCIVKNGDNVSIIHLMSGG